MAWQERLEAGGSGLSGAADPQRWAAAAEVFGYGAVYEQAVCRWQYAAAVLESGGDQATAAEELRAAYEVAERLGAVPLAQAITDLARRARLSLPGVAAQPGPEDILTGRERDVLEQVALGRTNRQIGEELYISEKTVSVHVSRVMAKLGAASRTEAVAVAYDRGLLTRR